MHNFPVPYENESIYSLVARAGVHAGITSPKQLLDSVFSDRKIIATLDLPCHLDAIVKNLNCGQKNLLEVLINQHTLFPTYASFISEQVRNKAKTLMKGEAKGALHLSLGVAASRIKHLTKLRYCPTCFKMQLTKHGEPYWERQWQYFGVDVCEKHGRLITESFDLLIHRHEFISPKPQLINEQGDTFKSIWEQIVAKEYNDLLSCKIKAYPTFQQWTIFYQNLAKDHDCLRGKQINHNNIKDIFISSTPLKWLQDKQLDQIESETSWLKSIFRKHRKSFSFLEHLTVIKSFEPQTSIVDAIKKAQQYSLKAKINKKTNTHISKISKTTLLKNRSIWQKLAQQYGPKNARTKLSGGAIYAWLYRQDRLWLIQLNKTLKLDHVTKNNRVDWNQRDHNIITELNTIIKKVKNNLNRPRQSKNWLLAQTSKGRSNAKNIKNLPLTSAFISSNCETTSKYQIRRLERSIKQLSIPSQNIKLWKLLRMSGLSKQRMTLPAQQFINHLNLV